MGLLEREVGRLFSLGILQLVSKARPNKFVLRVDMCFLVLSIELIKHLKMCVKLGFIWFSFCLLFRLGLSYILVF